MNNSASFCPLCSHCQHQKQLQEELEIARLKREERELEERLSEERRQERVAAGKLLDQGVIHGDNYNSYSIEDIRNIENYDFLEKLRDNIYPSGQPQSDFEMELLNERYTAVLFQLNQVLVNEME